MDFRQHLAAWVAVWPVVLLALYYVQSLTFTRPAQGRYFQVTSNDWWRQQPTLSNHWSWYLEFASVVIILAAVWFWIHASLGVQTYLCHPGRLSREAGDRAITLAYLSAAPLALLPAAVLAGAGIAFAFGWPADFYAARLVMFWTDHQREGLWSYVAPYDLTTLQLATACAPAAIVVLLTLRSIAVVVRGATFGGFGRSAAVVACSALAWPVLFLLFPVAVAAAIAVMQIILFSMLP